MCGKRAGSNVNVGLEHKVPFVMRLYEPRRNVTTAYPIRPSLASYTLFLHEMRGCEGTLFVPRYDSGGIGSVKFNRGRSFNACHVARCTVFYAHHSSKTPSERLVSIDWAAGPDAFISPRQLSRRVVDQNEQDARSTVPERPPSIWGKNVRGQGSPKITLPL
jgi:hypothetical protein